MPLWKGKTRGGMFGYMFFIYMLRYFGVSAAYVLLAFVVCYFIPFAPKATASLWWYGRRILRYNRWKTCLLLFRNYYRFGQVLIDRTALNAGKKQDYSFRFHNYPAFLEVLNKPSGVVMMGAHVGNWETGAPFFDDYGKKINIVMYDAEHRRIKQLLEHYNIIHNYKIISINNNSLTHVFQIMKVLEQGEYVCFQGDRYVNKEKLLTCRFMGEEAQFPLGPFLLAAKMRVPVVFYFAMRGKRKTYHFHFFVINKVEKEPGKRPEQVLLEQYVQALETILHRYPEQWFNYYPFWNKQRKL